LPRLTPLLAAVAVVGLAVLGQATVARADDEHGGPPPTPPVPTTISFGVAAAAGALDGQFVSLMNADRAQQGLAALSVNAQLTAVASAWTDELIGRDALSHNPDIVSELPAGATHWGENVGYGYTPATLETAFMASAPHRANILGQYTQVGVGAATGSNGMLWVTVDFAALGGPAASAVSTGAAVAACTGSNPPSTAVASSASGYYVLGSDGGVFTFGGARFMGSVPGEGVHADTVLMALSADGGGYYVLGADGGVFTFGDAHYFGSVPALGVRTTAVDLKPTRTGGGYWVLTQDGRVFPFGDAPALGSLPAGSHAAVKLVPTPSGRGYWVLASDGGIFTFGDARFDGSLPGQGIVDRSISMASTPSGSGYWVLGADGGIFTYGDATFHGSVPGIGCVQAQGVQIVPTTTGHGYYVLASDGRVFPFGDAPGYGDPSQLHITARDLAVVAAG